AGDADTKYNIYRKRNYNGEWEKIATEIEETTYTDDGVWINSYYYYEIEAVNQFGVSEEVTPISFHLPIV
uniref:fibronectin type III domain-containing protein n=1 Tax=Longirhabdus pacifica TaxID=2305227 RepID=UPI0013E8B508